ncbi:polyhydroxyalkanoate synthesis regulator DNA-binding domain-containing protein [Candidatus Leptofilum sp.]|uniref:polyhydroxyalkanoate synthesis regulator DNA-binding domain-containing protein n=1 Tax=Candidatus Leptofilum sp. TaxID=3241576 RepID=UPI003B599CCA
MPVIKRYPNRKLYDTDAKKYITLDGIAELIRDGAEVQVVDHTTEEDLTAVTLTQIIFEQEKRNSGFLPKSVLTGLVRAGGDTLNTLRRNLNSPLELLKHVDEEIDKRLQTLVERGEMARDEAISLSEKLIAAGQEKSKEMMPGQQRLERLLTVRGVPSREEVEQLTSQIENLSTKIDNLIDEKTAENDNNN